MFFLPNLTSGADVQIFETPSTVTSVQWHTWVKPPAKTMTFMFCLGGGGGGGGGFTRAAGAAGGGGGGGAAAGHSMLLIPTMFLPNILAVQVGDGGKGVGSGGGTAGSGIASVIAASAITVTSTNTYLISNANLPGGGVTGTGAAAGTGGSSGTVAQVTNNNVLAGAGFFQAYAGGAGVQGGSPAGAAGATVSFPATGQITTAGSGGGGTTSADFAGGLMTATGTLFAEQIAAQAVAGSTSGSGGQGELNSPTYGFRSYGGLGGGSSNTGIGGNGGNASYGSGGGGGGAGTTGGKGGDGGPGLVLIISW